MSKWMSPRDVEIEYILFESKRVCVNEVPAAGIAYKGFIDDALTTFHVKTLMAATLQIGHLRATAATNKHTTRAEMLSRTNLNVRSSTSSIRPA